MEPNFECAAQNGAEPLCRETAAVLGIMAKSDTADRSGSSFATGSSLQQVRPCPLCRESGSELSYRDAPGTNTMAETVTIDRPSVAKLVSRPRSKKPATVSASALALHLDCSRSYIG